MKTCFYLTLFLLFFVFSCNNDSQPKPGIIEITPMSDGPGVEVQIKGTNFSSDVTVFFNGTPASIISSSDRLIITTVPEGAATGKITVANGDVTVESLEDFVVLEGTWTEKAYIPFFGARSGLSGAVGFASAEKGYIGTGADGGTAINGFWCYDPSSDSWAEIDPIPWERFYFCVSFVIDEFAYIGLGKDTDGHTNISFYRLDMTDNTWSQVSDFPGTNNSDRALAFSIGSKGYVNKNNEMWEYNPETDDWTRLSDFPGPGTDGAVGATVGGYGYLGLGFSGGRTDWWQYNPVNDNWIQKADFPNEYDDDHGLWLSSFVVRDKIYLVGTGVHCWEYDPIQNVWTQKTSLPSIRFIPTAFSINDKGYMGTGSSEGGYLTKDLWEFEP